MAKSKGNSGGGKPERKSYHVTSNGDDGWKVKMTGNQRASSTHDTKAQAVERARELAKGQDLGQVVVHRDDGTIQTEWSYGADPHPPKG